MPPQACAINPNDSALAWRRGKLVLDNLALADALPLISRYLNKLVMLADIGTGTIRIGGIYNSISEVNNLVPSLPKVLPVYLTQNRMAIRPRSIPRKAPQGLRLPACPCGPDCAAVSIFETPPCPERPDRRELPVLLHGVLQR